jgi:hypothetical protein
VEHDGKSAPFVAHLVALGGNRFLDIMPDDGPMKQADMLDDSMITVMEADIAQELGRAVAFAEAGTLEPVSDLERDVYTRPLMRSPAQGSKPQGEATT